MKKIIEFFQKFTFPTIIALSALSVSASAAFYSVTGLSKLFAGASFEVLVMAGSLEIAKLVIASLLYQYWTELNRLLKIYLTIAAAVLVMITSAGIYGFLSAAYQETASRAGVIDKQIELLEVKKNRFDESRTYYLSEKKSLDESISELRQGLSNNVIQYRDRETGQILTTTSSSTRIALQKELEQAISSRDGISKKLETVTDSITSLEIKMLDVENNSDVASELGPLKYISELTGTPMAKVVNILMLVIIFVFDPLAVSLVIAANFAFARLKKKDDEEEVNQDDDDLSVWDETLQDGLDDLEEEDEEKITPSPEELDTLEKYLKKMEESKRIQDEMVKQELEKTKYNPTETDLERLQRELDKITKLKNEMLDIENSENEVKLTEEEGEDSTEEQEIEEEIQTETPEENTETQPSTPQPIRRQLIYQKRDGRNAKFDRI
jgi:hypothetical protein